MDANDSYVSTVMDGKQSHPSLFGNGRLRERGPGGIGQCRCWTGIVWGIRASIHNGLRGQPLPVGPCSADAEKMRDSYPTHAGVFFKELQA